MLLHTSRCSACHTLLSDILPREELGRFFESHYQSGGDYLGNDEVRGKLIRREFANAEDSRRLDRAEYIRLFGVS